MLLQDQYQRKIRKLRLSVTDNCNLRCHYCMPEDSVFMPEKNFLSIQDYKEILNDLIPMGLEEVRLTGGEPLMRKSFSDIAEVVASFPLKKIGLTTNAILLDRHFETLKKNHIIHLNISLDSLDEQNFKLITKGNHFQRVIRNIEKAIVLGFNVKINTVLMKGINDHEVENFIQFSAKHGVEVRFLELMRIGHACGEQNKQFISADEIISRINKKYSLTSITKELDSTSFNYKLDNNAVIGFIASESKPFCTNCSRWRLSADGLMMACLLKSDGISLKSKTKIERHACYQELLGMKPYMRPVEVTHQMNSIGG